MDQQEHLTKLKTQQEELIGKHQKATAEVAELRDNILKIQGAIDYLNSVALNEQENEENIEFTEP